jgi:aspartyl protease family protein
VATALGYVRVKTKVRNPEEKERQFEIELLVDTGAIYSIIPAKILESLKIERRSIRKMRLADGSVIERHLGIAEVEVKGETAHSNVIFGEEADASILGVTALEELGLQVDPITGELKPMELLLL